MSWTYSQLYTAIQALPAATQQAGTAAIVTALNAQTTTLFNQPITYQQLRAVLKSSGTNDYGKIVVRSRQTAALPPVSAIDNAIIAANLILGADNGDMLNPNNTSFWAGFTAAASNLVTLGDLSSASDAAIVALISVNIATWNPAVVATDIAQANLAQ